MGSQDGYLLDNRRREAGQRFDTFAELFDPWTFAHLDRVGLGEGRRCWEVGAGGPSVPAGLARSVGPTGRVWATDIDTSWLTGPGAGAVTDTATDAGPIEVLRHDVTRDEPPATGLDLVHARLVLVHLPDRAAVLARLASALRPGGWLIVEDADPGLQPLACPADTGAAGERAERIRRGFRALLAQRGADLEFGRSLPGLLRGAGLQDVQAEGYFPFTSPAGRELEAATVRQVRGQLVDAGPVTDAEIDAHLACLAEGTLDVTTAPLITCWGRRGAAP
ncbi:methyltransferase domain-containing protein [Streptomyces iconiensis]|uniref:Methyltransferase domain-containing protein n=2 Tax=Streptomyces iconiensis TaxID=1384038 RepID=A0ABT6ZN00_9ACTN|nr:methyltransferase domain-containing protein [Streptomyces iconiensis]MDJ1130431.1 methyltransferase domain-containing protein [Streptomyces iconiensis]